MNPHDASQPVRSGIDRLLAMAAVNSEFAAALLADRTGALAASGVDLGSTEQAILASVDEATLRNMIASMAGAVPEPSRRAFLSRSAAALLALATGGVAATTSGCPGPRTKGISPDRPPATRGISPDRPEEAERLRREEEERRRLEEEKKAAEERGEPKPDEVPETPSDEQR